MMNKFVRFFSTVTMATPRSCSARNDVAIIPVTRMKERDNKREERYTGKEREKERGKSERDILDDAWKISQNLKRECQYVGRHALTAVRIIAEERFTDLIKKNTGKNRQSHRQIGR